MDIEKYKRYFDGTICQYCDSKTEFVDSAEIYGGKSYGMIYLCRSCGAYVGCYPNSKLALGMVANEELRLEKRKAHHYFDQLWKKKVFKSRHTAYYWLSKHLGIPIVYTHIGMSDVEQCRKITILAIDKLNQTQTEIDHLKE